MADGVEGWELRLNATEFCLDTMILCVVGLLYEKRMVGWIRWVGLDWRLAWYVCV